MNTDRLSASEIVSKIMEEHSFLPYIRVDDIPNIDLYMDQVTTFMEDNLGALRRSADDKILTKTMINNYAKNKLLPPPVKKKYSREHLLMMLFIYYFKGFLNLQDIKSLMDPLSEEYFHSGDGFDVTSIYREISLKGSENLDALKEEIMDIARRADHSFEDAPEEDQEFLKYFSLISYLSIDVYIKKRLIETLIDTHNGRI